MLDVAREQSWTCLTYYYRVMVPYLKKKKKRRKEDCSSGFQWNIHLNIDNLKEKHT